MTTIGHNLNRSNFTLITIRLQMHSLRRINETFEHNRYNTNNDLTRAMNRAIHMSTRHQNTINSKLLTRNVRGNILMAIKNIHTGIIRTFNRDHMVNILFNNITIHRTLNYRVKLRLIKYQLSMLIMMDTPMMTIYRFTISTTTRSIRQVIRTRRSTIITHFKNTYRSL